MSIFLQQSRRYTEALNTFDPFEHEPIMRLIDPLPRRETRKSGGCSIPVIRPLVFVALFPAVVVLCCLIPSPLVGGSFVGPGSLSKDFGFVVMTVYTVAMWGLLLVGRRVLGDLMNELVVDGITKARTWSAFRPWPAARTSGLRLLERVTRLGPWTSAGWFALVAAFNLYGYFVFFGDGRIHWVSSPADPSSIFYALRIGARQPNVAGLWAFLVVNAFQAYLLVLAARLFICYACLCQALANDPDLHVVPTHPDRTGGLLAVGQVSFFFAVFTFAVGVAMTGVTMSEILVLEASHMNSSGNVGTLAVLWGLYWVCGTALFFAPALPLRARMAGAKRDYLHRAHLLYAAGALRHRESLHKDERVPETFQEQAALGELLTTGEKMAVWPFDRETFVRFGTMLFGPVLPLLFDQAPKILKWLRDYFLLTPTP